MTLQRGHPYRTVVEQLADVYWKTNRGGDLRAALDGAYDVEAVTKTFFREYDRIFKLVLGQVTGLADDDERKLFCQTLFNRLMFLYFLQRKGWLTFDGGPNYLHALWHDYQTTPETERTGNFYTGCLRPLFFTALSNARSANPEMYYGAAPTCWACCTSWSTCSGCSTTAP